MAMASIFVLDLDKDIYLANTQPMLSHINIGTGNDITIYKMAHIIKRVVGFKGEIVFDKSKLEGPPRKLMDVTRLSKMGWTYNTDLEEGLKKTYAWYISEN